MRLVGISLAAAGLSSLLLSAAIVHAVVSPVSHDAKPEMRIGAWKTTVVRQ
jgi:hypothetical protein